MVMAGCAGMQLCTSARLLCQSHDHNECVDVDVDGGSCPEIDGEGRDAQSTGLGGRSSSNGATKGGKRWRMLAAHLMAAGLWFWR